MATLYAGIENVEYADVATGTWVSIPGPYAPESDVTAGIIKSNTTTGSIYGGGEALNSLIFLNKTAYPAMRAAMLANTPYWWRITFQDGTRTYSLNPMNIHVTVTNEPDARTGLSTWSIEFMRFGRGIQWFNAGPYFPVFDNTTGGWLLNKYGFPVIQETFIPSDFDGLKLWLESDMGVTLVGGEVDSWADQSGNGNHYSAPTALARPIWDGESGGLRFNVDKLLQRDNVDLISVLSPQQYAVSIFGDVEYDWDSDVGAMRYMAFSTQGSTTGVRLHLGGLNYPLDPQLQWRGDDGGTLQTILPSGNQFDEGVPRRVEINLEYNTAGNNPWSYRTSATTVPGAYQSGNIPAGTAVGLSARSYLGRGMATAFWRGRMRAWLVYNTPSALTQDQKNVIFNYISNKYN